MRTQIYIVIMHDNMCRISIIGESSSNLGGIKFKSLKVYSILKALMVLILNYFALENMLRSDIVSNKIYNIMRIRLYKEKINREQGIFILVSIAYHLTLIFFNCDIKFDCCQCACRIIYKIFSFEWLRLRW